MNKQEKELLISFVNSAKEDLNFSFGKYHKTCYGYIRGNKLINYIEQLNESEENLASTIKLLTDLEPDDFLKELKLYVLAKEPQKVKVPAFVADWYEMDKKNLEYRIWNYIQTWNDQRWNDFKNWMNKNSIKSLEILIKMQDGYEVEEELQWIVKCIPPFVDEFRYYSMDDEIFDITESSWTSDKEDAYPFTEKEKAEALALLVDGRVEEV